MQIVSDYEELFKFKKFAQNRNESSLKKRAYECTYERLKNDLKNQYSENLDDKINRWLDISQVQYFQDVLPITFYIQAKMLYRDGFYEAAISVSRSICEMICYEELAKTQHSFGDITIADKHSPGFTMLKQFLLLPKRIEKSIFQKEIISKINDTDPTNKDSNFIKSSYQLNKLDNHYQLKTINAKKDENLNRFMKVFKDINFPYFETFTDDILQKLEYVWMNGSTYVHVKKSENDAKTDAFNIINEIGFVLFNLYGSELEINSTVVSAYSRFEDVCTGVTFGMDVFLSLEESAQGYYNLPSDSQGVRMRNIVGEWNGEWGLNGNTTKGVLEFRKEGEYVNCYLKLKGSIGEIQMGISFYGDYFFINQINGDRTKHFFQLSFLDKNKLVGQHKTEFLYAIFERQN